MIDFALAVQLDDTELAVQETARRFAGEVLRPVGAALDKLPAGEMIQAHSPLFDVHRQYRDLGFAGMRLAGDLTPAQKARLVCLIGYELGRGDVGLALSLGAANFPAMVAANSGRRELMEQFTSDQIGCWGITEPDHGSDELDVRATASRTGQNRGRANCIARPDGNAIVINGQKSSWVSNGTIAETAALFCAYDDGSDAAAHGVFLVDLKEKGVSRGKPTDKLGQRALNQGEIFFDEVRIPAGNMAVPPERYADYVNTILVRANSSMGITFSGLAQAAFDEALAYAKERKQGGVPIIQHQNVKSRLFEMFRKVMAARALNWQACMQNFTTKDPRLEYAIATKVTSTQTAFEVASDAMTIFGGAGIVRDHPVEQMLRDARISMIEDGCNDLLGLMAADRF
ncbi:MAG: acyl-CoA/acyl-ACP dehydrogenase [Proteobacteria bacterium]|nr:acyl-CoA/acyl-ACP dehydrogenase [Pseudomonadota bacterium]